MTVANIHESSSHPGVYQGIPQSEVSLTTVDDDYGQLNQDIRNSGRKFMAWGVLFASTFVLYNLIEHTQDEEHSPEKVDLEGVIFEVEEPRTSDSRALNLLFTAEVVALGGFAVQGIKRIIAEEKVRNFL